MTFSICFPRLENWSIGLFQVFQDAWEHWQIQRHDYKTFSSFYIQTVLSLYRQEVTQLRSFISKLSLTNAWSLIRLQQMMIVIDSNTVTAASVTLNPEHYTVYLTGLNDREHLEELRLNQCGQEGAEGLTVVQVQERHFLLGLHLHLENKQSQNEMRGQAASTRSCGCSKLLSVEIIHSVVLKEATTTHHTAQTSGQLL